MSPNDNKRKAPTRRKPTPRSKGAGASSTTNFKEALAQSRAATGADAMRLPDPHEPQAPQEPQEPREMQAAPRPVRKPMTKAQRRRAEMADDVRQAMQDPRKPTRSTSARAKVAPRVPLKKARVVIIGIVAVLLLVGLVMFGLSFCQGDNNKLKACEQWRHTVKQACIDCNVDTQWTDAILALMAIESGGDPEVKSVEGVAGDLMQAAEGAYGDIVKGGSAKYNVKAQTPEASIYAGVLEFKQNYKLWKKYLNGIGVSEVGEIQLVIQGYNFGAEGWYKWCKKHKVKTYTVEKAKEYSDTKMPEGAKGTPTHGEKWLSYYEKIRG